MSSRRRLHVMLRVAWRLVLVGCVDVLSIQIESRVVDEDGLRRISRVRDRFVAIVATLRWARQSAGIGEEVDRRNEHMTLAQWTGLERCVAGKTEARRHRSCATHAGRSGATNRAGSVTRSTNSMCRIGRTNDLVICTNAHRSEHTPPSQSEQSIALELISAAIAARTRRQRASAMERRRVCTMNVRRIVVLFDTNRGWNNGHQRHRRHNSDGHRRCGQDSGRVVLRSVRGSTIRLLDGSTRRWKNCASWQRRLLSNAFVWATQNHADNDSH